MHIRIVMMIGIGSITDGIVVVITIVAHWLVFHIAETNIGKALATRKTSRKQKLTEHCEVHEGPPGQP